VSNMLAIYIFFVVCQYLWLDSFICWFIRGSYTLALVYFGRQRFKSYSKVLSSGTGLECIKSGVICFEKEKRQERKHCYQPTLPLGRPRPLYSPLPRLPLMPRPLGVGLARGVREFTVMGGSLDAQSLVWGKGHSPLG
jgi:hypothetical protein